MINLKSTREGISHGSGLLQFAAEGGYKMLWSEEYYFVLSKNHTLPALLEGLLKLFNDLLLFPRPQFGNLLVYSGIQSFSQILTA